MTKILKYFNITERTKLSFMSWIGSAFIVTYIAMSLYSIGQIHYLFLKGLITEPVFERMIASNQQKIVEIVMIIVLYFFRNGSTITDSKQTPIRKEDNTDLV